MEKEITLSLDEMETVLKQISKQLDLDLDIARIVDRARQSGSSPYKTGKIQISNIHCKKKSSKELSKISKMICRLIDQELSVVRRYIYPDEEIVLSRRPHM